MIKLPDGELRDYLPVTMKNDVDMICLSYAIRKETEQLVKYQKATMIYHFIDSVPEPILDLLAVELRSLYYSDKLPIGTKRDIVKNTLRWHMQAGTPGAVAEMIKVMFGDGEVVEWPDFDEPPYTPGTFDIVTDTRLTPDTLEYLVSVLDRVKNVRSHMRSINIRRNIKYKVFWCACQPSHYRPPAVVDGYNAARETFQAIYAGAAILYETSPSAVVDGYNAEGEALQTMHAGIVVQGYQKSVLAGSYDEMGGSQQPCICANHSQQPV